VGVEDVHKLLSLSKDASRTCGQVHDFTLEQLAEIRRRIADRVVLAKLLGATTTLCEGGEVPACAVIEALPGWRPQKIKPLTPYVGTVFKLRNLIWTE